MEILNVQNKDGHVYTIEELTKKVEEVRQQLIKEGFYPYQCERVSISKKMTKMVGRARKQKIKGTMHYTIQFSYDYLSVADRQSIMNTIAHEAIHLCEGCFDHKQKFKYAASKMKTYGYNIERLTYDASYSQFRKEKIQEKKKYEIYCRNCGQFFGSRLRITEKLKTLANPIQRRYSCPKCESQKFKILEVYPDGTTGEYMTFTI